MINMVILQGRPTKDPEILHSDRSGKVYCRVRLAVERDYKGKNSPKVTDYFNITCFDRLAQSTYNGLCKGALCTVIGRLTQDEFVDAVGNRREGVNVIASRISIHEWMKKSRPFEALSDSDDPIVPREIAGSLYKQIDLTDEDIPDELLGELPVELKGYGKED